jgi:hypothetical protein
MITKLEQRCDMLSEVVQRHDKGKTSLVDKLLQKTASPFTDEACTWVCTLFDTAVGTSRTLNGEASNKFSVSTRSIRREW